MLVKKVPYTESDSSSNEEKALSMEKGIAVRGRRFTQAQLQGEFNYLQAENITRKLLEKGLITNEEFERIMALNRRSFPTFLAPLY